MGIIDSPHRSWQTALAWPQPYRGSTWRPQCYTCGGSGWRVLTAQGDPVPGMPGCYFASSTYVTCECRIVRSEPSACGVRVGG